MTCQEYENNVKAILERFVEASNTEDPEEWDEAFGLFMNELNDNEVAFGHPPFPATKRP